MSSYGSHLTCINFYFLLKANFQFLIKYALVYFNGQGVKHRTPLGAWIHESKMMQRQDTTIQSYFHQMTCVT